MTNANGFLAIRVMDWLPGPAPNGFMSRNAFGSWSRAERIAAVGVVVAVLVVGTLVLSGSISRPSLDSGWTRIPIAPRSVTFGVHGSANCNPVTETLDDAAYFDQDAHSRLVSLHVVATGGQADPLLPPCGSLGLGLVDDAGRMYAPTVWVYPSRDGHWSTYGVDRTRQHLRVDGGPELSGTLSLY